MRPSTKPVTIWADVKEPVSMPAWYEIVASVACGSKDWSWWNMMAWRQAIWKKSAKRDRKSTRTCTFCGMFSHEGTGGAPGTEASFF